MDTGQLLSEARQLYRTHPSTGMRAVLRGACLVRLDDRLCQENSEYAAVAKLTRRGLSPYFLMLHLLEHNPKLAGILRQAPEFREAVGTIKEDCDRFPSSSDPSDWFMLNALSPAEAARITSAVRANQAGLLSDELQYQLNPVSTTCVIEQCCAHRFLGDSATEQKIYAQALQAGLPLPPL